MRSLSLEVLLAGIAILIITGLWFDPIVKQSCYQIIIFSAPTNYCETLLI